MKTEQTSQNSIKKLRKTNHRILEQQESMMEEERLKMLLQITGDTAHELTQPLTALLGNIELMKMSKDNPEEMTIQMERIEKAGKRISNVVQKFQNIPNNDANPYLNALSILNLNGTTKILFVEDSDKEFQFINDILKAHRQINLHRIKNMNEAMKVLRKDHYDIVLLDYVLPDGNALDFLKTLRQEGLDIPVVIITGQGDEMIASQLIQAGAYDYLPRERVSEKTLSLSINKALEKFHLKKEIMLAQQKMYEMSIRDGLTGLYNRRYFMEVLEREVERARRFESDLALCMIDIDHFKKINDTYGHQAGDRVLSEIGRTFDGCIRKSDFPCRYGGDEFAVILPNTKAGKARVFGERFRKMAERKQFEYNSCQFHITVSMGITSYESSEIDHSPSELIEVADKALYQAKKAGRNRVVECFNPFTFIYS